jgi:hypothetical protein
MPSDRTDGSQASAIMRFLIGGRIAHVVHTAAELGLADHLGEKPIDAQSLAEATGTHPASLARLLRALAAIGVVYETDDRRYTLTPLGASLRTDQPGSMRARVRMAYHEMSERPWQALSHAVRTGEHAFRHVFQADFWTYLSNHPENSALFDEAQQSNTQGINASLASSYPFSNFKWIVDVGGGNGSLLIPILKQNPGLRGTVFELPHVTPQARERIAAAGLASRCDAAEGNALAGVPLGADAYVLKSVIHGHEDDEALTILHHCRAAVPAHGRVLLIERILPEQISPRDEQARENILSDINMMLLPGGRERTEAEYTNLLNKAGLRLDGVVPTPGSAAIIEAAPI